MMRTLRFSFAAAFLSAFAANAAAPEPLADREVLALLVNSDIKAAEALLQDGPYELRLTVPSSYRIVDEQAQIDEHIRTVCKETPDQCEQTKKTWAGLEPIERFTVSTCVKRKQGTESEWQFVCLDIDVQDTAENRKWLRALPTQKSAVMRVWFDKCYEKKTDKKEKYVEMRFLTRPEARAK